MGCWKSCIGGVAIPTIPALGGIGYGRGGYVGPFSALEFTWEESK